MRQNKFIFGQMASLDGYLMPHATVNLRIVEFHTIVVEPLYSPVHCL